MPASKRKPVARRPARAPTRRPAVIAKRRSVPPASQRRPAATLRPRAVPIRRRPLIRRAPVRRAAAAVPLVPRQRPLALQRYIEPKWEVIPLEPDAVKNFLDAEGLLKRVPSDGMCAGCYPTNVVASEFLRGMCQACQSLKNHVLFVSNVEIESDFSGAANVEDAKEITYRESVGAFRIEQLDKSEGAQRLAKWFRDVQRSAGRITTLIMSAGWTNGSGGHRNVLFFYFDAYARAVRSRLFDPYVSSEKGVDYSEFEFQHVNNLKRWIPMFIKAVLSDWRYIEGDYGEACPIGLQSKQELAKPKWCEQVQMVGYCVSWSLLMAVAQIRFPQASIDDIVKNVSGSFPDKRDLRQLISGFGYNIVEKVYLAQGKQRTPHHACCFEDVGGEWRYYYTDDDLVCRRERKRLVAVPPSP